MIFTEIGDIAKILNGYAFKSTEYAVDGFQVIRITNVQAGYISNNNPKFIQLRNKSLEKFILSEGDLLISLTGNVGRVGKITKQNLPAVLNQRVGKIFIKSKEILPEYLFHILKSKNIELKIIEKAKGIAQKNISSSDLEKIQIPLPSINEQKKIVEMLNAAEALLQKRKEAIRLLDEYLKSVFLDMFGDPAKNISKFEIRALKEVSTKITDGEHSTPKRTDSGIKLLSARNIKNGYIDFSSGVDYIPFEEYQRIIKRCNPEFGDILISCSGTIGRVTTVNITEPFTLVRSAALVKLNKEKVQARYLEYYLRSPYLQRIMIKSVNQSSQANLFLGQINKLPILVPPMSLQTKFEDFLKKTEDLKQKMQEQAVELENHFHSLLQKAFKGELANN